jgi:hypothetical protein
MSDHRTLEEWAAFAHAIIDFYESPAGLQREPGDYSHAELMNWQFHWREEGMTIEEMRAAIRNDRGHEWRDKHPGEDPGAPASAPPALTPTPAPPPAPQPIAGGGIPCSADDLTIRPRWSRDEMARLVPSRGPFTFPPPWNTRAARVTNADDGPVRPVGMAYWPVINADDTRVLVSLNDTLTLFAIDPRTLGITRLTSLPFNATGEYCYFSLTDPDLLYVSMQGDSRLRRYRVSTGAIDTVVDAGAPIRQCHSSADGRVHSFTLDGAAAVYRDSDRQVSRFSPNGDYDECQVDKSGEWLLSKEQGPDGQTGNRVIHLASGREWFILKAQGGVGHSDMGWGYVIGEDDQTDPGGVFRRWLFTLDGPVNTGVVYATEWTGMTRYVSHCNARDPQADRQAVLFSSSYAGDRPRANEIVLGNLDGSRRSVVLCPNLTDLDADGVEDYWRKTRACLSPSGRLFAWSGNLGTGRLDVFVGVVPR